MTTKEKLQGIVADLSEDEAQLYLDYFKRLHDDPLFRKLASAPVDDEPLSSEDEAALEEAYADFEAGRVVSHEELKRSLGES
jgi:hypothetical protein